MKTIRNFLYGGFVMTLIFAAFSGIIYLVGELIEHHMAVLGIFILVFSIGGIIPVVLTSGK